MLYVHNYIKKLFWPIIYKNVSMYVYMATIHPFRKWKRKKKLENIFSCFFSKWNLVRVWTQMNCQHVTQDKKHKP